MKRIPLSTESFFLKDGIDYVAKVNFVLKQYSLPLEFNEDPKFYITSIETALDVVPPVPFEKASEDVEDLPEIEEACLECIYDYYERTYNCEV
jgi:hypothetical protein